MLKRTSENDAEGVAKQEAAAVSPNPTPGAFDPEPLLAASQRSMQGAAEAQAHLMRRIMRANQEFFGFVDLRLRRDREAAHQIARCRNVQEWVEVWSRFLETAIKDYADEATLMARLYADQAKEAADDVQHQVERALEPAQAPEAKKAPRGSGR